MSTKSEIEREILSFCKTGLRLGEMTLADSLIVRGATSLKLMRLVSHIYSSFDVIVELPEIMHDASVGSLAQIVLDRMEVEADADAGTDAGAGVSAAATGAVSNPVAGDVSDVVPAAVSGAVFNPVSGAVSNSASAAISAAKSDPVSKSLAPAALSAYPLSDFQMPFWDMCQYRPAMVAYNEACSYLIEGALDPALCQQVLREVVRLQPALRTTFVEVDGVPMQQEVAFDAIVDKLQIEVTDLGASADPLAACELAFPEFFNADFELDEPPLLRCGLWQLGEKRWVFSCVVYHIAADLWSVDVVRDLAVAVYRVLLAGGDPAGFKPSALINPSTGLGFDAADASYWQQRFATPVADVNLSSRKRPAIKSYAGAMILKPLAQLAPGAVEKLRAGLGVPCSSLTFAAYSLLLHARSGQQDVTVGVPYLVRQNAALQDAVGMFLNTLPVRIAVDPAATLADFVRQCHGDLMGAFEHGKYPVYRLMKSLPWPTSLSRAPLFEQNFTYYEKGLDVASSAAVGGFSGTDIELPRGTAKYDLSFFITSDEAGKLYCKAEYCKVLFAAAEVEALVADYENILQALCRDSTGSVAQLLASLVDAVALAD